MPHMLNCIIVDDETAARTIVSHLCSQVDNLTVVDDFPNAMQAIKYLNKTLVPIDPTDLRF